VEATRRLIRPPFDAVKGKPPEKRPPAGGEKPKSTPAENTNAENFYYAKQIQQKTPMVLLLNSGEEIRGQIEWYDKHAIRVTREELPAVMIYKASIRIMYKDE
jgi:host factor-I protein